MLVLKKLVQSADDIDQPGSWLRRECKRVAQEKSQSDSKWQGDNNNWEKKEWEAGEKKWEEKKQWDKEEKSWDDGKWGQKRPSDDQTWRADKKWKSADKW